MAVSNTIIVKFRASGDKAMKKAIIDLAKAEAILKGNTSQYRKVVKKLNLDQAKLNKHFGLGTKNSRLLAGSFATLRSKMLLFSFAMSMGISQLIKFGKEASKLNAMERAFNTMIGATEDSSTALKKLKEATNGTMSEFDLFQQANNAMILGVSKNSDEMAEMFDMAQRLGAALGKDTKMSVESLITGIGRQSRLMLDNIGIMMSATDAYEDYARVIDKDVEQLTDFEKKQAFLNATLDSARQKLAGMPPEVISTQMAFDDFSASTEDLSAEIGQAFLPVLVASAKAMTFLMDKIDADRIQRWAVAVGGAAIAFGIYRTKLRLATAETITFQLVLAKTGWGTLIALAGLAAGVLMEYFEVFKGGNEDVSAHAIALQKAKEAVDALAEAQKEGAIALQLQLDILNAANLEEKMLIQLGHEASEKEKVLIGLIVRKTEELQAEKEAEKALAKSIKAANSAREKEKEILQSAEDLINENILLQMKAAGADEKLIALKKLQMDGQKLLNKEMEGSVEINAEDLNALNLQITTTGKLTLAQQTYKDALLGLMGAKMNDIMLGDLAIQKEQQKQAVISMGFDTARQGFELMAELTATEQARADKTMNDDIARIKDTKAYKRAAERGDQKAMDKMEKDAAKKTHKLRVRLFEKQQNFARAEVLINAAQAALTVWKQLGTFAPAGLALLGVQTIMSLAAINAQKAPAFATGGLVGGRRHSQGGTMIEAEQGEFVMSRNAVDAVGLEGMNRINQGRGGSVNVTFTGNVMSQDFIENEAIPQIKEAIRRGADIGIS